jgi:hypothetical protein
VIEGEARGDVIAAESGRDREQQRDAQPAGEGFALQVQPTKDFLLFCRITWNPAVREGGI